MDYDDLYIEALQEPMKYLRHDTDAHKDPQIGELVIIGGMKYYGLYWLLAESLATHTPHFYNRAKRSDERALKRDLSYLEDISAEELEQFLQTLAELGLINTEMWSEQKVCSDRVIRECEKYAKSVAGKRKGAAKVNHKR